MPLTRVDLHPLVACLPLDNSGPSARGAAPQPGLYDTTDMALFAPERFCPQKLPSLLLFTISG